MQRAWSRRQAIRAKAEATRLGDDDEPRPASRLHRNGWLFLVVGLGLLIGAPATRLLQAFRGVVLEKRGEQMFVAFEDRPPKWLDAVDVEPGTLVDKELGDWHPHGATPSGRDYKLLGLYQRYNQTYDGVIVRIEAPVAPGQASTAVAEVEGGRKVRIPLWSEGLSAAAVGRRLHKYPSSWDPVLVDDGALPTGSLAPAPSQP